MNKLQEVILISLCCVLIYGCKKDDNPVHPPVQPTNHAPLAASNPSPSDSAKEVSVPALLSWTCSDPDAGDILKYDLYIGVLNSADSLIDTNLTSTTYSLSGLQNYHSYCWKIIAKDDKGLTTVSPVWRFITKAIPPTQGLMAYYPFNGNANDASGNGNNGTVNGATLTTDRFGRTGHAYLFNGSSNNINCGNPQNNSLDLGTNATLSAWVNFNSVGNGYQVLIGKDIGPGNCIDKWIMWYNAYSNNYVTSFTINWTGCSQGWLGSNVWTPITGQWYHIAIAKSGNQYTFFLNGNQNGYTTTTVAVPDVNADLTLGMADGGNFLNGSLDDVRIYNYALSTAEIQQLYHEGGW
jgi:hypothetical protein